jgi:cystathionine beta-lyase
VPFELIGAEYITPLPALRQALNGAGALLLSNPHNPWARSSPAKNCWQWPMPAWNTAH